MSQTSTDAGIRDASDAMTPQTNGAEANVIVTDLTPADVKVSVIMLAYRSLPYLAQAISGVLSQKTDFGVQLVLSDDASDDATADLCRRYASRYPDRITLVEHRANVGTPRNFLDAHARCKGEYIAMCDADDYWCHPRKLQSMVDFMDSHPDYSACFHRVINSYQADGTKSLSNGGQQADLTLADLCRANPITNCSSLFRRDCCPTPPAWMADIVLCDYAMHLINAMHGKARYMSRPMAVYRKHSASQWVGDAGEAKRLGHAVAVRERALDLLQGRPEREIMLRNYTDNAVALIAALRAEGADDSAAVEALSRRRPDLSQADIDSLVARRQEAVSRKPSALKRAATAMRRAVSRLIPLPALKHYPA